MFARLLINTYRDDERCIGHNFQYKMKRYNWKYTILLWLEAALLLWFFEILFVLKRAINCLQFKSISDEQTNERTNEQTYLVGEVLHQQSLDKAYHSNGCLHAPNNGTPVDPKQSPEIDWSVVGMAVEFGQRLLAERVGERRRRAGGIWLSSRLASITVQGGWQVRMQVVVVVVAVMSGFVQQC